MKKKLLLLLTVALTAFILSGCVQSDTNIKIGLTGNIELEMTSLLRKDTLQSQIGGQDVSAFLDQWVTQNVAANEEQLVDDNEELVMQKVEAAGENGDMYGVYMKVSYKDWEQFSSSAFFTQFVSGAIPSKDMAAMYLGEEKGLEYKAETNPFGTKYTVTGSFTMDDVAALNGVTPTEGMENAKITFKLSAPLFTTASNSINRSPFRTTHVWELAQGGTMTVDFKAFIPNIVVLVESIIILALIILIIVMAADRKRRKAEEMVEEIEGQLSMEDGMLDTESENFFEQYEEVTETTDDEVTRVIFEDADEAMEETETPVEMTEEATEESTEEE